VELRELAADHRPPVAELGARVGEAREQPVGRLENDQGVSESAEGAIEGAPLARFRRRESGEGEGVGRKAGGDESGEDRRRSRDRFDPVPRFDGGAHQGEPRIGEERRAGVRDDGDGLSLVERRQEAREPGPFVVLVERQCGPGDPEVLQQTSGAPGVLAGDEVRLGEGARGPGREVVQVADGRRDEQEAAGHRADPTPGRGREFDVRFSVAGSGYDL